MVKASIWKDTYYSYDGESLNYIIKDDNDTVIFAGKAYRLPTEDEIKINVNGICKDYLSNDLRPLLDAYEADGTTTAEADRALRIFRLYDGGGNLLEEYEFLYDWSYDTDYSGGVMLLSRPINWKKTANMFGLYTTCGQGSVATTLNSQIYNVVERGCTAEYAIYYLNSYGGWDSFLFEGKSSKKDNITQYTTDRNFNNTTLDYELYRYVSEINTSYTLATGWLNDAESKNFAKNLVGSNHVYLHDLVEDKIFPAVITDNSVTYQKMRDNGGKMSSYVLNVKCSQNKLRQ